MSRGDGRTMLAADLKDRIDWAGDDPLARIGEYLNDAHVIEPKIDGVRAGLLIRETGARFADNRSASFPMFAQIGPRLRRVRLKIGGEYVTVNLGRDGGTELDGEFLSPVLPGYDRPLLNHTTGLFNSGPLRARDYLRYGSPRLVVFDVTRFAGTDCTRLPYRDRRALLEGILSGIADKYPGCGVELIDQLPATEAAIWGVLGQGDEGVVIKALDGPYQPGKRSPWWLKVKRFATIDCYLTGNWTPGENSREGTVGAVEVAVMDAVGNNVVIGDCALKPFLVDAYTIPRGQPGEGGLRPELTGTVWEIMAQGVNEYGHLRHPHMVRVRTDKSPGQCSDVQLSLMPRV